MEFEFLGADRLYQAGANRGRHSKDLASMNDLTPASRGPGAAAPLPTLLRMRGRDREGDQDDIIYPSTISFVLVHLACLAAIWTGITWQSVAICIALYWLRIFAIGAGYHRYFSHRAYSTSRIF